MHAFIIARLSSTRLPRKNILLIDGKPMIVRLAERIMKAEYINQVSIITSVEKSDDELEEVAKLNGLGIYRGSLDDIPARILGAAQKFHCLTIVEILGDNLFVDPDLIDETCRQYNSRCVEYVSICTNDNPQLDDSFTKFPLGIRSQVYNVQNLFDQKDFESYFLLEAKEKWKHYAGKETLNIAINYEKNFHGACEIFQRLGNNFTTQEVIKLIESSVYLTECFS